MTTIQKTICGAAGKILTCTAVLMLLTGCGDRAYTLEDLASAEGSEVQEPQDTSEEAPESEPETICVFVCGEVNSPGVIRLEAGSRAGDALELAGGLTESGDEAYVNLAQILEDGQKLYFPSVAEAHAASGSTGGGIDINTADAEKLCELPGIGKSRAAAIVEYRTKYGRFEKPEDLMQVSGIGEASFERLRPYITVN